MAQQPAAGRTQHDLAAQRATELVAEQLQAICRRTDRLFAWLLVFQWLAAITGAIWIALPAHIRPIDAIWWATLAGALASGVPLLLIWRYPGTALTRHTIAASQMLWSSLLMEFTGGHLGSHFPVFASLAILACYRDWRVLLTATAVFVAREIGWQTLWPFDSLEVIREWERLVFLFLEVAALTLVIRLNVRENWLLAVGQARLEESNRRLDAEFRRRSANYREYTERLERIRDELHVQAKELQSARAAAEEANAAKSHLVATVSHEIRTPLTAILGYADVLLANLADAESSRAARTIKRNGEFLLQLVDDILDLSKIESGKLAVESLRCWPRQIVSEVVQLLKVRADAKGLPLVVEFGDHVPRTIHTDPMRLRQILLNLVSNAIKFSSRGDIRIRIAGDRDELEQATVRFEVCDQGIGLTSRQIDNLFSPFSQGDEATSRLYGGSGLGLWISKRLANLLGGDIVVHSAPGQGSTFIVTVAARKPGLADAADALPIVRAEEISQAPVVMLKGRRVLIADDSADNRELVTFILERSEAQVTAVNNGVDAVRAALEADQTGFSFDVILMDVQMPKLDGFAATERLREQGYTGLIVALTAHARPEELQQSRLSGCDACLSKPIDGSLLGLISQMTQRAEADRAPTV